MFSKWVRMRPLALAAALLAAAALAACSRSPETAQQPQPAAEAAPITSTDESKAKPFRIGELEAVALLDGALDAPNDGKIFAINRTPEEVATLLTAAGLPGDKLNLTIHPLLVRAGEKTLLFDTGTGTNMGGIGNGLMDALAAAGIDAASVTDIFISHLHGDHIGGLLNAQGAAAFPNATIHISTAEWEALKSMSADSAAQYGINQHPALIAAMEPKVAAFAPGAEIVPGVVTAVDIKGHTPGHSGFRITSGESSLLYIGDAMHHYVVSVQKPDWTIAFDTDAPTAEASRRELLASSADGGQRIYAVHFPFPGLGKIERQGEGFVWVPE